MPLQSRRCLLLTSLLFCLLLQAIPLRAEPLDVREQIARESKLYRATHPEFPTAPKHDFRPSSMQPALSPEMNVPGGVGYGYYFNDSSLRWTNSTVLDYYIISPRTMGGDLSYYLYLTSTCRAQLGTEALISYYAQNPAGFWVFDWSMTNNQWQVGINLPDSHPEYLVNRFDESGYRRSMCRVRNGTFLTGFSGNQYTWENRVWLFNFQRGDWDLLYLNAYTTASLNQNLFVSNATLGYWGPIVEVFLDSGTYDNLNPAGFDLTRLFQDANSASQWLNIRNSYSLGMAPFQVLSRTPDRGFSVYTGPAPTTKFWIAGVSQATTQTQPSITINTVMGHQYQLLVSSSPGAALSPTNAPLVGNGTTLALPLPMDCPAAFFRVRDSYIAGSLNVVVNTNAATFSLDPSLGTVDPVWALEPDGRHWDKTVVALSPGTYTINFGTVPGVPAVPSQTVTITRGNMSTVQANYALPGP